MNREMMVTMALLFQIAGGTVVSAEDAGEEGVRLTARVVDSMGSIPGKSTARVKMQVDIWSPDEEIVQLVQVLIQGGDKALYEALRDMEKKGYLSVGSGLAQNVVIARSVETENGRVIRMLLNRPITFFEAVRGLRLEDYPFGFVEVTLDKDGKGEGELYAAAKITLTEQGIDIQSYGVKPLRLMGVKLR